MIPIYTSAPTRNLISVSVSSRLQTKAKDHEKWTKRWKKVTGGKKIAHVKLCEHPVRKQRVNTTGIVCGFPPKPLPWG